MFMYIDKNSDGYISVEEFKNHFSGLHDGRPVPFGLFHREDVDQDGAVSWFEFSGPKGNSQPTSMVVKSPQPKSSDKEKVNLLDEPSKFV